MFLEWRFIQEIDIRDEYILHVESFVIFFLHSQYKEEWTMFSKDVRTNAWVTEYDRSHAFTRTLSPPTHRSLLNKAERTSLALW